MCSRFLVPLTPPLPRSDYEVMNKQYLRHQLVHFRWASGKLPFQLGIEVDLFTIWAI